MRRYPDAERGGVVSGPGTWGGRRFYHARQWQSFSCSRSTGAVASYPGSGGVLNQLQMASGHDKALRPMKCRRTPGVRGRAEISVSSAAQCCVSSVVTVVQETQPPAPAGRTLQSPTPGAEPWSWVVETGGGGQTRPDPVQSPSLTERKAVQCAPHLPPRSASAFLRPDEAVPAIGGAGGHGDSHRHGDPESLTLSPCGNRLLFNFRP
ncbi:unnamed protein product [Boreogadus saida]